MGAVRCICRRFFRFLPSKQMKRLTATQNVLQAKERILSNSFRMPFPLLKACCRAAVHPFCFLFLFISSVRLWVPFSGRVIPQTIKMVLIASLLGTQYLVVGLGWGVRLAKDYWARTKAEDRFCVLWDVTISRTLTLTSCACFYRDC